MAINTGVNVSKAVGYAVLALPGGINISKAVGYVVLSNFTPTVPTTQRGNIDYDQIRSAARTGNGSQLLTYSTTAPGRHTDVGTAGQIAYDSSGNWYWCYATNTWARMGPGGYSNTF